MRTGHLFAGAGGGLLADRILGYTPVFAVEWDGYCCEVLRQRSDDGWFPGLQVHEGDISLWDPSEYAGRVDSIHAGFPCTDISVAGNGEGIKGDKSGLWSEVVRVADVLRPQELFLENSPAIVNRGLDRVLSDLAALGYDAKWICLSASAVGANHRRDRWWCLANARSGRCGEQGKGEGQQPRRAETECAGDGPNARLPGAQGRDEIKEGQQSQRGREARGKPPSLCGDVADADQQHDDSGRFRASQIQRKRPEAAKLSRRQQMADTDSSQKVGTVTRTAERTRISGGGWWDTEPDVGRVGNELADRVHRLKALGNGQVPLQAAMAYRLLKGQPHTMISTQYAQRDLDELGEHYARHVQAMTDENLHSKMAIAAELAYRDQVIDLQREQLRKWASGEWRFAHRLSTAPEVNPWTTS